MADRQLQGWCADPFGLHDERYFSSGRPTKLVRDGKVESYEDPPSETYQVPDDEPAPRTEAPSGYAPNGHPRNGYAGIAPPRAGAPRQYAPGVTGQYAGGPGFAAPARRRSPAFLIVAAVAIVAATIAGMLVLVKQESPSTHAAPNRPTAITPVAFVQQSAAKTLAERTADVTLSGTVQTAGRTVTLTGTGGIDFAANAMDFNLSVGAPSPLLSEKEILDNGNLFIAVTVSGASLAKLTGGRDWIEMPVAQSGSANLGGSDPLSSLSLLEQQGISVRQIGTLVIEGHSCTGYAVIPTKAAMLASARAEFAKLGYSSAMIDQETTLVQQMQPPVVTVWLDAQGLMREMSINLDLQTGGSGGNVTGSLYLYVSNYGAPVQVTAPPSSDTISYSSFLQALGAKG